MPVIVVANPKGGAGKSTLSTNVAGYFASKGHAVMLGDADVQQSSKLWLDLRPDKVRPIATWELQADLVLTAKPPRGTTHVVIDTPGGLGGWRFKEVVSRADRVMIPIMPSIFDMYAAQAFITQLREVTRGTKTKVGIVGMRVDERTIAANRAVVAFRQSHDEIMQTNQASCRFNLNHVDIAKTSNVFCQGTL